MKKQNTDSLYSLVEKAKNNPEWFWREVDEDVGIVWHKEYTKTVDTSHGIQWPKWFVDGKTNIILSSLEKHAKTTPSKIAYYFVSENGKHSKISYKMLEKEVNKFANVLKSLGVQKGDVVGIYLPMIKEAIVSILAAAKIGAIQTVIFSGYSTDALYVRLADCKAKVLIVSDGLRRKGKQISQKKIIENAIKGTSVDKVIVVPHTGLDKFEGKIFQDYNTLLSDQSEQCKTEIVDSEDPLFILYTSGTTGKPKGVIHSQGGFSVFAGHQAFYLIDLHKDDILFWPADIGWITGLVWNVYGLLIVGASALIYDGALDFPDSTRVWKMIDEYNITIFGISPTAVRLFRKDGIEPQKIASLDTLRNIPTTGEPIDEESWWWLFEKVGKRKIPIMNLSGGTEIGGAMLSVFPGMRLKPKTVGIPCPGMNLDVIDEEGNPVINKKGFLVVKYPWPAMTKGLLHDKERYLKTYWSKFDNMWFHGDYVLVDEDGLWYMHGRVDDVINISGHRLSTAEIEHCVCSHKSVTEAAAISVPDDITGEAVAIFVVPEKKSNKLNLEKEVTDHISEKIGKVAKPKYVFLLQDLPKTRTGKIMRRLLKAKFLSMPLGDLSSVENIEIIDKIPSLG